MASMMGGPATGRMFGGLNNISGNIMKALGGLNGGNGGGMGGLGALGSLMGGGGGGMGGLGALGSLMGGGGGGMGGLGALGSLMGGGGGLGGLGALGGLMGNMMGGNGGGLGNMRGPANQPGAGAAAPAPDLSSLFSAFSGQNAGGMDLNAILSQLGNMQQPAAGSASAENEPPIEDAQFRPVEDGGSGPDFAEERFGGPGGATNGAGGPGQAASGGGPDINSAIWQMLSGFLNNQAKQGQASGGQQQAYRGTDYTAQQNSYDYQGGYAKQPQPYYDVCFDCPLTCPRAGLKLPPYNEVRLLAQDWRRY